MLSMFKKEVETAPATVDEAISNLTVALDNLATVSADKRAEAMAMNEQARILAEKGADANAEADRADRIHGNIAALLK